MNTIGDRVIVKFDLNHNKVFDIGGIEIIKPDIWEYEQGESDDKMEGKVNKLLVNPQIATVMLTNSKHKVSKGDKVFLHYMAYEHAEDNPISLGDEECHMINGMFILFKILEEGQIQLMDDIFLGEVILENRLSLSGIHINVFNKRKSATIKITHVPDLCEKTHRFLKPGHIVKTIDDYQYPLTFNNKEYIKLTTEEIVGIIE